MAKALGLFFLLLLASIIRLSQSSSDEYGTPIPAVEHSGDDLADNFPSQDSAASGTPILAVEHYNSDPAVQDTSRTPISAASESATNSVKTRFQETLADQPDPLVQVPNQQSSGTGVVEVSNTETEVDLTHMRPASSSDPELLADAAGTSASDELVQLPRGRVDSIIELFEPACRFRGTSVRGSGSTSSQFVHERTSVRGSGSRSSQLPRCRVDSIIELFEPAGRFGGTSRFRGTSVRGSGSRSSQLPQSRVDSITQEYERAGRLRGFSISGPNDQPQYISSRFVREAHKIIFPSATILGLLLQLAQMLVLAVLQQPTNQETKNEKGHIGPLESLRNSFFRTARYYGFLLYAYFGFRLLLTIIPQLPYFFWRHYLCCFIDELVSVPCGLSSLVVLNGMFNPRYARILGTILAVIWSLHIFIGLYHAFIHAWILSLIWFFNTFNGF